MNNLKNSATGYRTCDEFHFDYMLGHYIRPELALGITGSHYRQTTADNLANVYSEASSIGPVVMYTPHLFDRDITVSLKYLREFNVQGRAEQEYLVCRIFMAF